MMIRRLTMLAILLAAPLAARADFTTSAVNLATIQPDGPRTGSNGKVFLNVEGSSLGSFASFAVVDFLVGPNAGTATSLSLSLVEDNAAFTAPGSLNFYLTTDTTTSIDPGTSPLAFQASGGVTGIGNQLSTLYSLGSGSFTTTGNTGSGKVDTYQFALGGAAQAYLTSRANAGGRIRLVIGAATTTVAATFAGIGNTSFAAPVLTVTTTNAVPEPASVTLLAAGGIALAVGARIRRHRAF